MTPVIFPYIERQHVLLGTITQPAITLQLYSERFRQWFRLKEILADTGADISVFPLVLGRLLVADIERGQPIQLGQKVLFSVTHHAFVHHIRARLREFTFVMPVAIAMSAIIPPIFGRKDALDRFSVRFVQGQRLIVEL